MSKAGKLIRSYYPYFILAAAFGALLFWNAFYLENWLDSDMAAEMMFSRLLTEEGKLFATTDWYYSTEFRFLYTHLIMGPLFRICDNWHVIRMITNVIFYLLLLLSYFYMMAELPAEKNRKVLGGVVLLLPFSETMMLHMHMGNTYMSHVIILFFYVGLFLRLVRNGKQERGGKRSIGILFLWAVYLGLSVICGVSGVRYMLALQCPLALASVWYLASGKECGELRKKISREKLRAVFSGERLRFLAVSLAGVFGCAAGYAVNVLYVSRTYSFQTYENTNFIDVYQGVFTQRLQDAFGSLLMLFGYIPGKSVLSLRGMISLIAFLLLILLGYVAWRVRKEQDTFRRFVVLLFYSSFLLNSFVFVFTNSTLVPRYYITTVILLIPLTIFYLEGEDRPLDRYAVVFLLAGCLFLAAAKTGLSMMTSDKNAEKKVIAQELEEMGYTFGYATYWNANIVQELSNGRVEIANLHRADDGSFSLFKWSSMQRYYEPDYPQGKVFLLLTEEEEQGMLREGKTVQEDGGSGHFGEAGQEDTGGLRECGLLRAGREVFRGSGYVVYEYENNADFLEAAQEVFS